MKKAVLVSIAVSVTLMASAITTYAKPISVKNQTGKTKIETKKTASAAKVSSFKEMPSEISGTVEKITENEMTVKVKDGEVYWVPLDQFSKLDGFKELGLKKDTKVSLKSLKASVVKDDAVIFVTPAGAEGGKLEAKDIKKGKIVTSGALQVTNANDSKSVMVYNKAVPATGAIKYGPKEGEAFFIASEITANGKTVKLDIKVGKAAVVEKAQMIPTEISGSIETIDKGEMTVKAKDGNIYWVPLDRFTKLDEFKGLDLKSGTEVKLKNTITNVTISAEKGAIIGMGETVEAIPAEGLENIVEFKDANIQKLEIIDGKEIKAGKLIFIADEITANGKTVKLTKV